MSHTHAWVLVHCVFSTKQRANLIPDPDELCRYLTGIARAKNVMLVAAGGTANQRCFANTAIASSNHYPLTTNL